MISTKINPQAKDGSQRKKNHLSVVAVVYTNGEQNSEMGNIDSRLIQQEVRHRESDALRDGRRRYLNMNPRILFLWGSI